jgi:hypothetical protein
VEVSDIWPPAQTGPELDALMVGRLFPVTVTLPVAVHPAKSVTVTV